ncbi:MAG TPA: gamma-glutamyltransferase [Thermotogota bacterium]|nr:gamma-glutamyltransferase [Thermotogota bacterium]
MKGMKTVSVWLILSLLLTGMVFAANPLNLYGRGAENSNGVVAAAKPEASQVGVDILKKGGNAVDAAIATAFALGVLEPNASGLGGGGFMIIKLADMDEPVIIDFRECAPLMATPDIYKYNEKNQIIGSENTIGGKASGVPGEVAGLLYALDHYGTMSRAEVIAPAIEWAEKGIPVTVNLGQIIKDNYTKILEFEPTRKIYLKDDLPYEIGDTIYLKDLANTLRKIAKDGASAFYTGEIAQKIVDEVQKQGGILTLEDLATYEVKIRKPVMGTYRGYKIISTPPASSGGTHMIELLNILENFDMAAIGDNTPLWAHLWSEGMKLIFADRSKYMADIDFVKVPLEGLTPKAYAQELAKKISLTEPMPSVAAGDPWAYESGSTTHLSVADKDGNMVAITKSINYFFGSGVVVPGTGILMNNHMDDFVLRPGSVNSIEPKKRPLSSMSPTLVLMPDGRPFMAIGSPGATRIITTVAQVISNVIDHGMDINTAILAPRLFRTQSGPMSVEGRISLATYEALLKMGHELVVRGDYDPYFGGVHAVLYVYDWNGLSGGADPRRDGQAVAF